MNEPLPLPSRGKIENLLSRRVLCAFHTVCSQPQWGYMTLLWLTPFLLFFFKLVLACFCLVYSHHPEFAVVSWPPMELSQWTPPAWRESGWSCTNEMSHPSVEPQKGGNVFVWTDSTEQRLQTCGNPSPHPPPNTITPSPPWFTFR